MWTSYNLGLVDAAGEPSDDSVTRMGAPGSEVLDGQPEDRLHRAGLTSVVQALYTPEWAGGQSVSATIPVCNRKPNKPQDPNGPLDKWGRRIVAIRFLVLEEPFLDVGVLDADGQLVSHTKDNGRFDWLHRGKDGTFALCSGPTASGQKAINPPECGTHQLGEPSEPYIDLVSARNFEVSFNVGSRQEFFPGETREDGFGYGLVLRDMAILNREIQMAAAAWAPGCIGVRRILEVVAIRAPLFMLDDGVIDSDEVPVLVDSLQQLNLSPAVGEVQEVIVGTTFALASNPEVKAVGVTYFQAFTNPPVILINASTAQGDNEWVDRGWDPILAHEFGHAFSRTVGDYRNYPWMIYPSEPDDCWVGDGTCELLVPGVTHPDGPMSEMIDQSRRLPSEAFENTEGAHYLNEWEAP